MKINLAEYTTHYSPINKSVHCDPVTALAIGSAVVGGGASYFGGQAQAKATQEGANKQDALARWMYEQDRQKEQGASNYLQGLMPTFNTQTPDANKFFGAEGLNQYYDKAEQNLNYNMDTQIGDAQASAGAMAGARGLANPSGFVNYAGQGVRSSFIPQFGQLEQQKFGAQQDQQKQLYAALMQQLQFQNQTKQQNYSNQFDLTSNFGAPQTGGSTGNTTGQNYFNKLQKQGWDYRG